MKIRQVERFVLKTDLTHYALAPCRGWPVIAAKVPSGAAACLRARTVKVLHARER
jgi:hypothetical protein